MFKHLFLQFKQAKRLSDRGFTLIELLVVILIIAILIAIAAPAFLAEQDKAHDSAAKQTIAVVSKELQAIYISDGNQIKYPDGLSNPAVPTSDSLILKELKESEPQYTFDEVDSSTIGSLVNSAGSFSDNPSHVTFSRDSDVQVTVCVQSKSEAVFCQARNESGLLANVEKLQSDVAYAYGENNGRLMNLKGTKEMSVRCVMPIPGKPGRSTLADARSACGGNATVVANELNKVTASWVEDQVIVPSVYIPSNSVLPTVSGQTIVGQNLTALPGAWSGSPELAYQWQYRSGGVWNDIDGATGSIYKLTADQAGRVIRIKVTATNVAGSKFETSVETSEIFITPSNVSVPTISGTAQANKKLTADHGVWNNAATYDYQWQRDQTDIAGATSNEYTLTETDVAGAIRVKVTASKNGLSATEYSAATAAVLAPPLLASNVAIGPHSNACVVSSSGNMRCWGYNYVGQLGQGAPGNQTFNTPQEVTGVSNIEQVSMGNGHTCVRLKNKTMKCVGYNEWEKLGYSTPGSDRSYTFQTVPGLNDVTSIALAGNATCAVNSGNVKCWGQAPNQNITGISNAVRVAADGNNSKACAVLADGHVRCWPMGSITSTEVAGITNATSISMNSNTTCVTLGTGAAQCWGENGSGQLGLGNNNVTSSTTPQTVTGASGAITSINVGVSFMCYTDSQGAKCAGLNTSGQLGKTYNYSANPTPNAVAGGAGMTYVGTGGAASCGIKESTVQCWGQSTVSTTF